MPTRTLVALLLTFATPATAAAALVPSAPAEVGTLTDTATCLRATGRPGELLLQAPKARGYATDVRTSAGVTGTVRLGTLVGCAEGAGSGARLLLAAPVTDGKRDLVRAAFGPGAPVVTLARERQGTLITDLQVAVGPGGQAAVAWVETGNARSDGTGDLVTTRFRLARAPAGGALGPATTIASTTAGANGGNGQLAVGVDAAGAVTVATSIPRAMRDGGEALATNPFRLAVRTAADGAPLGAEQVLDPARKGAPDATLSVAPDGAALLAESGDVELTAWRRAPGGGAFAPALHVRDASDEPPAPAPADAAPVLARKERPGAPGVLSGAGGVGAIAWRGSAGGVFALTLPGAAPGPVVEVAPDVAGTLSTAILIHDPLALLGAEFIRTPTPLADFITVRPSLALAADGRLLLTAASRESTRLDDPITAVAAEGTLAGGFARAEPLTGPIRSVSGDVALLDAAGTPQAAVADRSSSDFDRSTHPDGRLRVTGGPAPVLGAPPAAKLVSKHADVRGTETFPVRVACSAACDIEARVKGISGTVGSALSGAGTAVLLVSDSRRPRIGTAHLPVTVTVTAPYGTATATVKGTLALTRLKVLPAPRITALRAVRRSATRAEIDFTAPNGLQGFSFYGVALPGSGIGVSLRARRVAPHRYRATFTVTAKTRRVELEGNARDGVHASVSRVLSLPR